MAEAAKGMRRKKVAREVLLDVACLAIQAEHGLGTALSQMDLAKGKPNQFHVGSGPKFLKELGLTKQESHRAQILAMVSKEDLERWLAERCAGGKEPTLTSAREFALQMAGSNLRMDRPNRAPRTIDEDLAELLEHQRGLTILLDRVRDGGVIEFEVVEGRLIWRLINEIGDLGRHVAKKTRNN